MVEQLLPLTGERLGTPQGSWDYLYEPEARVVIDELLVRYVEAKAALLGASDREAVAARILRETVGLGPIEDLLADPSVEEVMVNGPGCVYVERRGRIEPAGVSFEDEEELRNAIERILAPLGRRVDELSPMVDARLADGSRVNVVIPPLAVDGPALSIRRFGSRRPGPGELVELGTLTSAQRELLEGAVAERQSVLVSGGTGSARRPSSMPSPASSRRRSGW